MNPYRLALLAMPTPDKMPGICRAFDIPVRPLARSTERWQDGKMLLLLLQAICL
jgi:hypothetical protein